MIELGDRRDLAAVTGRDVGTVDGMRRWFSSPSIRPKAIHPEWSVLSNLELVVGQNPRRHSALLSGER